MKDYLNRLKDHPGLGFAIILTIAFYIASFSKCHTFWIGAIIGTVPTFMIWVVVLISNCHINRKVGEKLNKVKPWEIINLLTEEQVTIIIRWMNEWEQLKGTAIPMRFKEDFMTLMKGRHDLERRAMNEFGRWLLKHDINQHFNEDQMLVWKFGKGGEEINTNELVEIFINDPFLIEWIEKRNKRR